MTTFKITLKSGDKVHEVDGYAGICGTSPRDIQQVAAELWGEGVKYEVRAPAVGLFLRDVARA